MLFRKKKRPLFGANIEFSCSYCENNIGKEGTVVCALRCKPKNNTCKKYVYNPLLREPHSTPPLHTEQFSEEDFKL